MNTTEVTTFQAQIDNLIEEAQASDINLNAKGLVVRGLNEAAWMLKQAGDRFNSVEFYTERITQGMAEGVSVASDFDTLASNANTAAQNMRDAEKAYRDALTLFQAFSS